MGTIPQLLRYCTDRGWVMGRPQFGKDGFPRSRTGAVISRKTGQSDSADRPWLHGFVSTLRQPAVVLDQFHRILAANKPFYHLVSAKPQIAVGRNLRNVGNRV